MHVRKREDVAFLFVHFVCFVSFLFAMSRVSRVVCPVVGVRAARYVRVCCTRAVLLSIVWRASVSSLSAL